MRPTRSRLSAARQHPTNFALGAVLVGGASRRFGSDKAAAQFRGRTLLDTALLTLGGVGLTQLSYVGGAARDTVPPDVVHLADAPELEPCMLRGVVSALEWAEQRQFDRAMILACDIPLVTANTVARVLGALHDTTANTGHDMRRPHIAVAHGERDHWSCTAIHCDALISLRTSLAHGERAMHRATAALRVVRVAVAEHELTNVNDLATMEGITKDSMMHE